MIHTVETAARLLELPAATLHAGDVAQVLGRLVPGDGSWLYRWDPNSTAGPNGGTVLAPAGMPAAGRWLLCHSGTVDARCFGDGFQVRHTFSATGRWLGAASTDSRQTCGWSLSFKN